MWFVCWVLLVTWLIVWVVFGVDCAFVMVACGVCGALRLCLVVCFGF